jgi:hypothetical protein
MNIVSAYEVNVDGIAECVYRLITVRHNRQTYTLLINTISMSASVHPTKVAAVDDMFRELGNDLFESIEYSPVPESLLSYLQTSYEAVLLSLLGEV